MKMILALVLVALASNFTPTSDDRAWFDDFNHYWSVLGSYANLMSNSTNDTASMAKYFDLLAIDSREAFWSSKKQTVSSELLKAKTNYELGLSSFQKAGEKFSRGYVRNDPKMMAEGLNRFSKGLEYMNLTDLAIEAQSPN